MAKRGSFFDNFVFNLNLFAALVLLLTYTSSFLNPQVFWPVALLGLGYPYALIANALFIFYWFLKKKDLYVVVYHHDSERLDGVSIQYWATYFASRKHS